MTNNRYTYINIPNDDIALFDLLRAEEAVKRNTSKISKRDFFKYLLYLYMQVREDDIVRKLVMMKLEQIKIQSERAVKAVSVSEEPFSRNENG